MMTIFCSEHASTLLLSSLLFVHVVSLNGHINATPEIADNASSTLLSEEQSCQIKANAHQCNSNPAYMLDQCSAECYQTDDFAVNGYFVNRKMNRKLKCINLHDRYLDDEAETCDQLAARGECRTRPGFMLYQCAKTCFACFEPDANTFPIGVRQEIHPDDVGDEKAIENTSKIILDTFSYMDEIMTKPEYASVRTLCQNNDEYCSALAGNGACLMPEDYYELKKSNTESIDVQLYEFMTSECAPACQTCDQLVSQEELDILKNCIPSSDSHIFGPGDINRMFERIVGESDDEENNLIALKSKVKVHSRPDHPPGFNDSDAPFDYVVGGPWVVTIDDFLSEEECQTLISIGHSSGFERSGLEEEEDYSEEELAREKEGGEDAYRTSTNSWCMEECYKDPIALKVIEKLTNTTGIPDSFAENLQLLRYEEGQYYKEHHDVGGDEYYDSSGSRILTFFLYLSDVKEGGGTRLTNLRGNDEDDGDRLSIDIQPKRGRALIWPNVLNEDMLQMDERTFHEALTVKQGKKYGANAWFHLRSYKDDPCDHEALVSIDDEYNELSKDDDGDDDNEYYYDDDDDDDEYYYKNDEL